ncbi:uncharacterized protein PAC_10761 [Phialocephala subalpina]|uniref:Uncharacterized protein n=1 Tax=Phialocephala subalpina TaxID=576137 RepID=A0A1L7X765_9HELO|nr:uncharacterized protein PAC_10761 [Phialocephala subalpina]
MLRILSREYKRPPDGWSKRALTYWDCCQFGRNDSPTIGWIVQGEVDINALSDGLERAVQRRASWLRGRLARTETGSPPFEIHVPPAQSDVRAFTISVQEVKSDLSSVISYVPNGAPEPVIHVFQTFDKTTLNPRGAIRGVEEYIEKDLPLLHLHVIKASDATFISLCWGHAAMDAVGAGQIVSAWEQELNNIKVDTVFEDRDPRELFDFTNDVSLPPGWTLPGWIRPSFWEFVRFAVWIVYDLWAFPQVHGSIYIPEALITHWIKIAEEKLSEDEWVSRNDLVEAWIFKYGWSYHPEKDLNTMFTAINFRGRHPQLPRTAITNTAMSYVTPPLTTAELRATSFAKIALRLRQSTLPFSEPEHVAKVVAYEFNNMKTNNGKTYYYPLGSLKSRQYGSTPWAKLGLSSPKFGAGVTTISNVTYCADRRCSTLIDSESGDWRVDLKLPQRAWECLQIQMEKEKEALEEFGI